RPRGGREIQDSGNRRSDLLLLVGRRGGREEHGVDRWSVGREAERRPQRQRQAVLVVVGDCLLAAGRYAAPLLRNQLPRETIARDVGGGGSDARHVTPRRGRAAPRCRSPRSPASPGRSRYAVPGPAPGCGGRAGWRRA